MDDRPGWDYVILGELRSGYERNLSEIYDAIDQTREGIPIINPRLFKVDGRWGPREDYKNTVRAIMTDLKKRGLVEHIGKGRTGVYRITDAGRERLKEVEP